MPPPFPNRYAGWRPTAREDLPVVAAADLDPETFFTTYVVARKPVLIRGHLTDPAWKASSLWASDKYLQATAGRSVVQVEERPISAASPAARAYGHGHRIKMPFGEVNGRVGQ